MNTTQILVVEDENIVAKDIQNRLSRFGYEVTAVASSGEEALEKAAEFRPDLVLMDIMLRGKMDGTETAGKMRKQFNVPVVYLTAYADNATLQRARITEPFGYILKPFEEQALHTTIEMALYKHRAEEALRRARDELEVRVEERTADLKAANRRLQQEVEERKRAEDALQKSKAQLLQAQKMEAVGRLAGGVAHDFNNQMGVVTGYLDMALEDLPEDHPIHQWLLQIAEAVDRASGLTTQLLLFSSQQPMDRKPMDLNQQVRGLIKMLGRLLGEDLAIDTRLEEGLWKATADAVNMDQVVTNLAVNARDAMPGGGTLKIETKNVTVDGAYCQQHLGARPGRFVRLALSDTGTGMDAEVMSHLFEPFFTTKGLGKGTGLGLSVVYGIVQSHEGWITVESQPGKGSQFEIYLPALSEDQASLPEACLPVASGQVRGHGEQVLLVEDEHALREMLVRMLSKKGYSVQACGSITEARAALQGGRKRFDLILCDVVLKDGRGPDLIQQALAWQPDLAVVLMSGYSDERRQWERIREAGWTFLKKPVAMADLLSQVATALRNKRTL